MFTQPCCPGFESRCAGCLGGEDSTKVRGLEGQARCLLGFSCLHGEQTLGLKCLTPQPVGPRRGNHAKQQSHRLLAAALLAMSVDSGCSETPW